MNQDSLAPEERLRALDPAAGATYSHPDPSAMLARITAVDRVTKVRFADGFRLRVGSAAAAAVLVTAGAIGAIQAAAPSLSVLAIGGSAATSTVPGAVQSPDMMVLEHTDFVTGPDLTTSTSSAPVYALSAPSDTAAAASSVTTALGVSAVSSAPPATGTDWTVSGTGGNVYFSTSSGYLTWNYDNGSSGVAVSPPATTTPGTGTNSGATSIAPASAISTDQAIASAQGILSTLGVASSDLGTASASTYDDGNGGLVTSVSVPWVPSGVATGMTFDFTYDPQGNLSSADGFVAALASGVTYPIVAETTAVAELQQQVDQYSAPSGTLPPSTDTTVPTGTNSTPPSSANSGAGASASTTVTVTTTAPSDTLPPDTTPVTIPTRTETIDSAVLTYAEYTLSDGSAALLPVYQFTATDGSQWTQIAVDPAYVNLAPQVRPMIY